MAKPIQYCKVISLQLNKLKTKQIKLPLNRKTCNHFLKSRCIKKINKNVQTLKKIKIKNFLESKKKEKCKHKLNCVEEIKE